MFDRFRHAVLRPTDASFFLNQTKYRALISFVFIAISAFMCIGSFSALYPGPYGWAVASVYFLTLALLAFHPVTASLFCLVVYVMLLFHPTLVAGSEEWGMFLSIAYLAFYLRRAPSVTAVVLLITMEALETYRSGMPIDYLVGTATIDLVAYLIGVLFTHEEHLSQLRLTERNQLIASDLHSAITSELSSIVLLAQSHDEHDSGGTNATLDRIKDVAQIALSNTHDLIRTLSSKDRGTACSDESTHVTDELLAYVREQDRNLQSMGFRGVVSIHVDSAPLSEDTFLLAKLCVKEIYANIARHMSKRSGEYHFGIAVTPTELAITETNPADGDPNELSSGFGLSLLRHQAEISGGTMRNGISDGMWRIDVTIPLLRLAY